MTLHTLLQCTNLGGMEQVAYKLLPQLQSQGLNVRVATPRPFGPGLERVRAIDPEAWDHGYRGKFGWQSYRSFRSKLRQWPSEEAEWGWVIGTDAHSLQATQGFYDKRLLSHHYHHFETRSSGPKWWAFYQAFGRGLTGITYPTDFTRNEALRLAPWLRSKTHVVRYGYRTYFQDEADLTTRRQEARRQLGLEPDRLVVGNAGWLITRKRWDVFLRTAAKVREALPDAVFVVCGGGPEEARLRELTHSLGLENNVRFQGWVQDLEPHYRSWDLTLFPSDFDTLPCGPMEAASYGAVIVASLAYGGLGEFVKDGSTGVYRTDHDTTALAREIVDLWRHPNRMAEYRAAAKASLEGEFGEARATQWHVEFFGQ